MKKEFGYVTDREGNAVAGAEVYVKKQSDSSLLDLYSDNGVTPTSNPLTTDNDGEYSFYTANNVIKVQSFIGGVQQQELNNVQHYDLSVITAFAWTILDDADAGSVRTTIGLGTGDSPQFTAINLGHASDTTIARTGAGDIAIEGNAVYRAGGTDVPVADGGTGASDAAGARTNLGLVIGTDVLGMGGGTLTGDLSVPDEAYGVGWNGSVEVPTKNAVYDKVESLGTASGNWQTLSVQSASDDATIDFTGIDPDAWDELEITALNVVPATDNTDLWLRVGTGATPTWVEGASDYSFVKTGVFGSNGSGTSFTATDTSFDAMQFPITSMSNVAGETSTGTLLITGLAASIYCQCRSNCNGTVFKADGTHCVVGSSGRYNATTAITALRVMASSGNIASGKFILRGRAVAS